MDSANGRLVKERAAVGRFFPRMRFFAKGDDLLVQGTLVTRRGLAYEIQATFPRSYPYESPKVFVQSPLRRDAPHRFGDGSLCLHRGEWRPDYSVAVAIAWAAEWLHHYEEWGVTGEWPTGDEH